MNGTWYAWGRNPAQPDKWTVRVRLTITAEPSGGAPNSRRFSVRLRKNLS